MSEQSGERNAGRTCEPKCHAYGLGCACRSAEKEAADALRAELVPVAARALHTHVCGIEWDEWNNPCSWAGEDTEPSLKSYPVCCDVDLSGIAGAVVDALLARVLPPGEVTR